MSRASLLIVAVIALSVTEVAPANNPSVARFYFGQDPLDDTPSNPVQFRMPGETATFHLFAQVPPGNDFDFFAGSLTTTNPIVATPIQAVLINPTISGPSGAVARWTFVSPGTGSAAAGASDPNPGLLGTTQTGDTTFRAGMNSYYAGFFRLQLEPGTGQQIKDISLSVSLSGTNPSGMVYLGAHDPSVPASAGFSSQPDAWIVRPGPETPGLAGDYNGDGSVDAADYVVWRKNLGQNTTLPNDLTPGTVDASDYDVWRSTFGNTLRPAPLSAVAAVNGSSPGIQIVDQGVTPDGNRSYLVQVASSDPLGALAVELGFDGPIVDVPALAARVNDEASADFIDGTMGYAKAEDTWYDDAVWDRINRGLNPFTGTITSGFAADYVDGELFLALGSGVNEGTVVDLLQIVLEPGELATFSGMIFRDGQSIPVAGVIQVPEPGAASLLLLLAARLLRRSRR